MSYPNIAMIQQIGALFHLDIAGVLSDERDSRSDRVAANLEKINFYICSNCDNVIPSMEPASVFCCERK